MKKFIIALFTLLLFQNCCLSAEWIEINSKTYIDKETYIPSSKDNNYPSFWIKQLNNKSNHFIKEEKNYKTSIWYELQQWQLDCKRRKYDIKELIIYDVKGSIIDNYSSNTPNWLTIPPDTISESYYNVFCKYY